MILSQNFIFCAPYVVDFFSMISTIESMYFKCLFASHITDPGWLLTALGAVIKLSYFSSHPVKCYEYAFYGFFTTHGIILLIIVLLLMNQFYTTWLNRRKQSTTNNLSHVNNRKHLSSKFMTLCEQNPQCQDVILFLNIFPCIQITASFAIILQWMLRSYRLVNSPRPNHAHIYRDTWP